MLLTHRRLLIMTVMMRVIWLVLLITRFIGPFIINYIRFMLYLCSLIN